MDEKQVNFNKWYKDKLNALYPDPDAGFIILIVSLCLLERYLREKSKIYEIIGLDTRFYKEFIVIFPSIPSVDIAKKFWQVYRHGLMHQSALKNRTIDGEVLSFVGLHNDGPEIKYTGYSTRGDEFMVSPVNFSKKVISTIESDFKTFEGPGSPNHPISEIFKDFNLGFYGASGIKGS